MRFHMNQSQCLFLYTDYCTPLKVSKLAYYREAHWPDQSLLYLINLFLLKMPISPKTESLSRSSTSLFNASPIYVAGLLELLTLVPKEQ